VLICNVDFDLNSREPFVGSHRVILLVLLFLIVPARECAGCEVRSVMVGRVVLRFSHKEHTTVISFRLEKKGYEFLFA
jgi:hypothetical protein